MRRSEELEKLGHSPHFEFYGYYVEDEGPDYDDWDLGDINETRVCRCCGQGFARLVRVQCKMHKNHQALLDHQLVGTPQSSSIAEKIYYT